MKAKDVRKGNTIMHNGTPYRVMDFHHHTPGNLRAMVQLKLRNLMNGRQTETKVASTEDLEEADVATFDASFTYVDASGYHFMQSETFEEITISAELLADGKYYLQDGMKVQVLQFNGDPIGIQLPKMVTLKVVDTEPEMKGASVSNVGKQAKTDTGLSVVVPPFIKVGEMIDVNTETGEFAGRNNS